MFPGNLFYQSILLIFYFDNHIDPAECSLLSRAKNPINIVTDISKTAEEQVYFELPGTMQRIIPTRRAQNKAKSLSPVKPEYVVYQNEPFTIASPSINLYRYEVENPSLEPESHNRYETFRAIPAFDGITRYESKRTMADLENYNYYVDLSSVARTTNMNAYEPYRTIPLSENFNINQVSHTFPSLDKITRYKHKTVARTTTVNPNQPLRTIAITETFYQDQVSRTFSDLDKVNRYDPIRTITDEENVGYYEMTRVWSTLKHKNIHMTRTKNILKKVNQYQPLSTLDRYEPVITAPIAKNIEYFSMETIPSTMKIDRGKTIRTFPVSDDFNNYEPVISSPPPDYYRFEPSRTSPLPQILGRDDNNYHNEHERVSSPVKVYQYLTLRTSVTENPTLPQDIYRYEPVRTSSMPVYINPYEPLKFSAFYVDEPSRTTKFKLPNYMNALEAFKTADDSASQYLKAVAIPKLAYRIDASRSSTSKTFEPSSTLLVLNKLMETYQLTPFMPHSPPEPVIKSNTKAQFTPYLTFETSTYPVNTNFWVPLSTSKSPEYYWNDFMQVYPERTRETQDQYLSPVQTSLNVYKNKERLKTMIVGGNLYQLLPFETSRAAEDYWNEFMRYVPARTYGVKKTFPLRTSTLQIPTRTFKLTTSFDEDESLPYPKLPDSSYHTVHLTDSRPFSSSHQDIPSRTKSSGQDIRQHEPLRTSNPKDYFYQNVPVRTSSSPQIIYEHVPLRTSRLGSNNLYKITPMRSSRSASGPYPISPTRYTRSKLAIYQRASVSTSTAEDYSYRNKPFRTSTLPREFYETEPSRTLTPIEKVNKNEAVRTIIPTQNVYTYEPLDQPIGSVSFVVSEPTRSVSEIYYQTKSRQAFRTLWQPTATTPTSTQMPTRTTSEQDLKPRRTTKVFKWNFNDAEAAWPKVELKLSTTERRTVVTRPKRKFATYFPFYLRAVTKAASSKKATYPLSDYESEDEASDISEESTKNDTDADQDVRCYSCGLNISDVPYYPSCFHVFDQPGSIHVNKRVKYRVRCMNPKKKKNKKEKIRMRGQPENYTMPGKKHKIYRGGCFKRFVEFGEIYSERGCRTVEPIIGKSIASFRLAALEKTLLGVDEGCVVSPQAVLTPFARGVSLFARYHVCVCQGKYCNDAEMVTPSVIVMLFNIFLRIF